MRKWLVLGLAAVVLGGVGCTSSVHSAVRDESTNNVPTTDTGVLPKNPPPAYGGDAAGTLNLDANAQAQQHSKAAGKAADRGGNG